MPEVDDLLTTFLPRLVTAERALRDGDPSARPVIWSHVPPVTFFGAAAGAEPQCYALRVTTIMRREEGVGRWSTATAIRSPTAPRRESRSSGCR
jgi:hypothetical protein